MSTVQQYLDLDIDLLGHLVIPDSIDALREQEFQSVLIVDRGVRDIYEWQMGHLREHRQLATKEVLEIHFGLEFVEPKTAIGDLIERIRDRYIRNNGKRAIKEIIDDAANDPAKLAQRMLDEGKRLSELTVKRGKSISSNDWYKLDRIYSENQIINPPTWGFPELDDHFGGIRGLSFLLARRKNFKSWLAVNAALQNILKGKKVVFYSLEMPAEETTARMVSLFANIPYWKWERSKLSTVEYNDLQAAYEQLPQFFIEKPQRGSRSVRELMERALTKDANVVIIDQLQYVETPSGRSCGSLNNTGDYWDVCEELRDYTDHIPVLCVHQLNRSALNNAKNDERPDASQAKGSAAVEETASLQIGLWQNKWMKPNNELEIYSMVARSSVEGAWRVKYELSNGCEFAWKGVADELEME